MNEALHNFLTDSCPPLEDKRKTFELECVNKFCGLSYFEEEWPNSFYVKCHLCEWLFPNPDYKSMIDDLEVLRICDARHEGILNTPDTEDFKVIDHALIVRVRKEP